MQRYINKGYMRFLKLCSNENAESLKELLDFFLTIEEKESIASRVLLIQELLKGDKAQREIAADFGISIAKITRGSNALKSASNKTRKYLVQKLMV